MGARYVDLFGKDADEYYKQYYAFEQKSQFAFHRSDILERILGRKPKTLRAWIGQNGHLLVYSAAIASMPCMGGLIDQPKQTSPVRAFNQCVKGPREGPESTPHALPGDKDPQ